MSEKPSAEASAEALDIATQHCNNGWCEPAWPCRECDSLATAFDAHTRALREENEWLLERVKSDNAVCICGCPPDEHESYDGEESCEHTDHECLRACRAIASITQGLREERDNFKTRLRQLASEVAGLAIADAEIRQAIGNTNMNILMLRLMDAREALDGKKEG